MVKAEQDWINHFRAASVGFDIVTHADPYNAMDRTDPNVIKYKHALEAVAFALGLVGGDTLPKTKRIKLEDCLHWNAYAISMLGSVPEQMIKDHTKVRINEALSYVNGRIKKTKNEALLPYMDAPKSFPHTASMSRGALL